MINKALRIMIADPEHLQRARLERSLNLQGYYAIATVSNLKDMQTLLEYGGKGFDLVLINSSFAEAKGFDSLELCLDHTLMGLAVIFDVPP